MKRTCFLSVALAAAIVVGGCSREDRAATTANPGGAVGTSGAAADRDVSGADKDFVKDIVMANRAELEMARTATERGSTPSVKKFAQMMITDHTKAGTALERLATEHRIEVPAGLDDEHKEHGQKPATKRGLDFDRDYADLMVDGHQEFVDKLESRIDKDTLAEWKSKHVDPATGKKVKAEGEAMTVVAEKSDHPVTAALNQWAAQTYPVAFAHLQAAQDLQKGLKQRSTAP